MFFNVFYFYFHVFFYKNYDFYQKTQLWTRSVGLGFIETLVL